MARIHGRTMNGMFENGLAQYANNCNFTSWQHTTEDAMSGDGCFLMNSNYYGATFLGSEYIPVDPENCYYQMSVSMKTKTTNYLGNLGSGHIGFACYDADKNFISHHQAFSTSNTTLSRAANPGDTVIYIADADASMVTYMNHATSHYRSLNFYFPGSPYASVGGYTRYNKYASVVRNSITQTGMGDWEITLTSGLTDYGYDYAVGTGVGRAFSGGSYNYALGAPNYPTSWTTYTTPVMTGYVLGAGASGADFRDQTKFIKFLNLINYNTRTQTSGDAARYYIDNIIWHKLKSNQALDSRIFETDRFDRTRRGGIRRSDFFV